MWSPSTTLPWASTASTRSASPSKARPEVGARRAHGAGDVPEVRRAAVDVDVGAVRRAGDDRGAHAEALEQQRRDRRGGAVGAVDHDVQAVQRHVDGLGDPRDVALGRALAASSAPAHVAADAQLVLGPEQRLDALLVGVRELEPVAAEELDAVVGIRVVAGRDDGAEVGVLRRGPATATPGVGSTPARSATPPALGDARAQRVLEHRARSAGVAPDARTCGRAAPRSRASAPRRGPRRRARSGAQLGVREPANAVGAEELARHGRPVLLGATASRTAAACGPSSGRPSCARPRGRRGPGTRRA